MTSLAVVPYDAVTGCNLPAGAVCASSECKTPLALKARRITAKAVNAVEQKVVGLRGTKVYFHEGCLLNNQPRVVKAGRMRRMYDAIRRNPGKVALVGLAAIGTAALVYRSIQDYETECYKDTAKANIAWCADRLVSAVEDSLVYRQFEKVGCWVPSGSTIKLRLDQVSEGSKFILDTFKKLKFY